MSEMRLSKEIKFISIEFITSVTTSIVLVATMYVNLTRDVKAADEKVSTVTNEVKEITDGVQSIKTDVEVLKSEQKTLISKTDIIEKKMDERSKETENQFNRIFDLIIERTR